jgi:hypothetical protein
MRFEKRYVLHSASIYLKYSWLQRGTRYGQEEDCHLKVCITHRNYLLDKLSFALFAALFACKLGLCKSFPKPRGCCEWLLFVTYGVQDVSRIYLSFSLVS